METDALFWTQLGLATASFCHELLLEDNSQKELLEAVAGEDWEWMGASALMHLSSRAVSAELSCKTLQAKCDRLKTLLERQTEQNKTLKKKVSEMKSSMDDREWQLQEKIAALQQSAAISQAPCTVFESKDEAHRPHLVTPEKDSQRMPLSLDFPDKGAADQKPAATPTSTPIVSPTPSLASRTSRLSKQVDLGEANVIQTQPKRRDFAPPPLLQEFDHSYLDTNQILTPTLRQRNTR